MRVIECLCRAVSGAIAGSPTDLLAVAALSLGGQFVALRQAFLAGLCS
jgi:hypothetical protein